MQAQVIAAEGEQKASQALKEVRTMLLFFFTSDDPLKYLERVADNKN